ncbi:MAG: DNA-processing protein DprA [Bdellovibrionota bacterium]
MSFFNHLKSIEHSPVRWQVEAEVLTSLQAGYPLEELPCLMDPLVSEAKVPETYVPLRTRIFRNEDSYPKSLEKMFDAPWSISAEGTEILINARSWLGVVGSRDPDSRSRQWMDYHLAEILRKTNCGIVSGGARGVDDLAHRISMQEKRQTLVVLPSGLDQIYPSTWNREKQRCMDRGAVFISEYADQQEMRKYLFSHRNRLIAALSTAVLIIQAAEKSGTLMTAHRALELGKPVYVLPAHPLEKPFAGNLELLKEGAQLVTNAQDLISFMSVDADSNFHMVDQ